jgi:hypothetical protein
MGEKTQKAMQRHISVPEPERCMNLNTFFRSLGAKRLKDDDDA